MDGVLGAIQETLRSDWLGLSAWTWLIGLGGVIVVVFVSTRRRRMQHSRQSPIRRDREWTFDDSEAPTQATEPVVATRQRREGVGAAAEPIWPGRRALDNRDAPPRVAPSEAAPPSDWDRWKVTPEPVVTEPAPAARGASSIGAASEWAIDEERARHWQRRAAAAADRRYGKPRREALNETDGRDRGDDGPSDKATADTAGCNDDLANSSNVKRVSSATERPSELQAAIPPEAGRTSGDAPPALSPLRPAPSIGDRLPAPRAVFAPNTLSAPNDGPRFPIDIHDFGGGSPRPAGGEDGDRPRALSKSVVVESESYDAAQELDIFADEQPTADQANRADQSFDVLDPQREAMPRAASGTKLAPDISIEALTRDWARNDVVPVLPAGPERDRQIDEVACSVFARPHVASGETVLIQALLHQLPQLAAAVRMALEIDPGANRRGVAKLETLVRRGATVELFLESPSLAIDQPMVSVVWDGEPVRAVFAAKVAKVPPAGAVQGLLHVFVGGAPVGELSFTIDVRSTGPSAGSSMLGVVSGSSTETGDDDDLWDDRTAVPVATAALRYSRAFISYARKDFDSVSYFAEALNDCGIKVLVDLTSIEPGEDWDQRLYELVDRADVFYLMWSDHAARSAAVDKEVRHALKRYDAGAGRVPRIRPVVLQQPAPTLPEHLTRFHFNSHWLALRMAQRQPLFAD